MKTQLLSFCGSLGYDTVQPGQNCMHLGVNCRLNSGSTCCRSVQNLLPLQLLTNNIKNEVYRTINLPLVLYRCQTLFPTLRVTHEPYGHTQVEGVQEQDAKEEIWA